MSSSDPMVDKSAKMLHRDGNVAVVQLPERRFPAIALQGDTFAAISIQAEELCKLLAGASVDAEIVAEARDLCERLGAVREYYEQVLANCGVTCPYER